MIAIFTQLIAPDCGLKEFDFLIRLVLHHTLESIRQLGIWPLSLDDIHSETHLAIYIVNRAVRPFLKAHKILWDRGEPDGGFIVSWLNEHDGSADTQVQKELRHGKVKVCLTDDIKHLLCVDIQRTRNLILAFIGNLIASHKATPVPIRWEQSLLDTVGKTLS